MTVPSGVTIYGEVNTVPLDTYGWRVLAEGGGYDALFNSPTLKGTDLPIPHVPGQRPYPRLPDTTIVSIPLLVLGECDQDGTPHSNLRVGLITNHDYLAANLGIAEPSGDGTVPFVFHRDTLDPIGGPVTALGLQGWTTFGDDGIVRLDLSIPDGLLEELAGS